jgi:hypothetical protein
MVCKTHHFTTPGAVENIKIAALCGKLFPLQKNCAAQQIFNMQQNWIFYASLQHESYER